MHVRKESNRGGLTAFRSEMKRLPMIAMIVFIAGIFFSTWASDLKLNEVRK
jgi:hypothetical protein